MDSEDYVIKRNGEREIVSFDKILRRIKNLGEEAGGLNVNYTNLCIKIIDRLYNNIPTKQIDELTSQQCASLTTTHPDYGVLAGRVVISNHQKNTTNDYLSVISSLYNFNDINGNHSPLISDKFYNFTKKNIETINNWFDYKRDFLIDYFGFKTLERAYLMKVNGLMVERPQHMWMRVAIAIHMDYPDWKEKIKETYDLMSQKYFTHATPTLFNAGTKRQQMSSCYLLAMKDDSIDGIYDTLKQTALISKWAGGIGLHIHNVRADGTLIRGTNGTSNGIVPMLRVFNNTARYVDQCILPETYIYTTEGPKQIQHCESNKTNIFNSKSYECIENILEHSYNGEILSIETMHSIEPLKITDEHPVYCIRNQKKTLNYSVIKNRLNKNIIKPEWCDAKDLTYGDLLIFKIPEYEKNIENITKDDCYMYGLILGDGSMNNSSINCYLSLNAITKTHILDFTKTYLTNKCIQFFITRENNTNRIRWNKNSILPFRYNDIYDENREKKIHPKWLNLPIDKIKFIVKGLIDSDGCKGNELVFDTTSRNLLESLRYLLLRMGIPTSGYIRDRIGQKHTSKYGDVIENKRISYCLRIPKTDVIAEIFNIESGKFFKFFIHEKFIYSRIKNITKENYRGTLYDLQMKSTHDYMIHNGIVHNGGGKRAGSFAMYIEPWHADIESFLDMKKNHGDEERRARDLFYALWMPDLFMKRVQENGMWTLMCPHKCPGLSDVYGVRFEQLYTKYENENRGNKTVKARDLWFKILDSQIETGTPYILYKDAANQKSNQKNLGTIKSSNLCTEIIEYSDSNETAVCNLASISLSKMVKDDKQFNFQGKVILYTKNDCKWCLLLKALLNRKKVDFLEVEIMEENFEEFKINHNVQTLPQIKDETGIIGGYDYCRELIKPVFDYKLLHKITKIATKNLNKIIDLNFYPTPQTKNSNLKHRPIGLGVQGLADAYAKLDIPFHSEEAKIVNTNIFETIYHASLEASMEISRDRKTVMKALKLSYTNKLWAFENSNPSCDTYLHKSDIDTSTLDNIKPIYNELKLLPDEYLGSYSTFCGSPASEGKLQFDLWNVTPSTLYDWDTLRLQIAENGLRNSLLVAPMPTASTSQILGNNECFEPFTSNIYVRRTIAGEFVVVNKYLLHELIELGLWTEEIKNEIIRNNGSIQDVSQIPKKIKEKYKIVWEIPMKHILDMCADRGAYICQSQSTNLWMKEPTYQKLTSMHFYSWKKGLKTGIYYLRTKAKAAPQQFTIEPDKKTEVEEEEECLMCGS